MGNEQSTGSQQQLELPRPESVPSRPTLTRSRSVSSRLASKGSRYLPKALAQPRDENVVLSSSREKSSNLSASNQSPEWGVRTRSWVIRQNDCFGCVQYLPSFLSFSPSVVYSNDATNSGHVFKVSNVNEQQFCMLHLVNTFFYASAISESGFPRAAKQK